MPSIDRLARHGTIDWALPRHIREEYDAEGKFRTHKGRRWYPAQMYQRMSFEWVEENLCCPDCGGRLCLRPRARNGSRELGNVTCGGCGKTLTLVVSIVPATGLVRMSSYLGLLRAIEEKSLPDFVLLTYDKDSLGVTCLLYLRGYAVTPEFVRPGWRSQEEKDAGRDIWCDIVIGALGQHAGEALVNLVADGRPAGTGL